MIQRSWVKMIDEKTRAASKIERKCWHISIPNIQCLNNKKLYISQRYCKYYIVQIEFITENRECKKRTLKPQKTLNFVIFQFFWQFKMKIWMPIASKPLDRSQWFMYHFVSFQFTVYATGGKMLQSYILYFFTSKKRDKFSQYYRVFLTRQQSLR